MTAVNQESRDLRGGREPNLAEAGAPLLPWSGNPDFQERGTHLTTSSSSAVEFLSSSLARLGGGSYSRKDIALWTPLMISSTELLLLLFFFSLAQQFAR
jgi:hypothetical protein